MHQRRDQTWRCFRGFVLGWGHHTAMTLANGKCICWPNLGEWICFYTKLDTVCFFLVWRTVRNLNPVHGRSNKIPPSFIGLLRNLWWHWWIRNDCSISSCWCLANMCLHHQQKYFMCAVGECFQYWISIVDIVDYRWHNCIKERCCSLLALLAEESLVALANLKRRYLAHLGTFVVPLLRQSFAHSVKADKYSVSTCFQIRYVHSLRCTSPGLFEHVRTAWNHYADASCTVQNPAYTVYTVDFMLLWSKYLWGVSSKTLAFSYCMWWEKNPRIVRVVCGTKVLCHLFTAVLLHGQDTFVPSYMLLATPPE